MRAWKPVAPRGVGRRHPERIIPLQIPWLDDVAVAADEIRSNASLGFKAVSFPEFPAQLGYPSIFTEHWDPLLAACAETGTVVCLHTAASAWAPLPSPDPPFELLPTVFPVNALLAAGEWVWSGVPAPLPRPGRGALRGRHRLGADAHGPYRLRPRPLGLGTESARWHSDLRPSEVLRRNFWFCTIDDPSVTPLLDRIGLDHVMVESDYPHADSTWPDTQAVVQSAFGHLPARPTPQDHCRQCGPALPPSSPGDRRVA